MKNIVFALLVAALWASPVQAYTFKIRVDLLEESEEKAVSLAVPKGAEKASARYFRLAERTHPVLVSYGYAALPDQARFVSEDPLANLDSGIVADDLIQNVDKDVEYTVRTSGNRKSFVLSIVNRKNEALTAEIELKRGRMREPVYRRVYSEDGGRSWTTIAWQPPRESDLYPWTVEVPANTVQTVTICLR